MKTDQSQNRIGNAFPGVLNAVWNRDRLEHGLLGRRIQTIVTLKIVTAATTEIKIDVVVTGIVTVTTAVLRSCVEPL